MDVINRIASLIKQPPHKAHMTDPEIAIVVEVFRVSTSCAFFNSPHALTFSFIDCLLLSRCPWLYRLSHI